jgi:excisionase family DNA binding protein
VKVETEKLLSVAQAARLIGISDQAVKQAIREHRLREVRIADHIFILVDEVMKYKADPAKIKLGKHAARKRKETNGK